MIKKNVFWLLFIVFAFSVGACKHPNNQPDVSKSNIKLKVLRFENDLFQSDFEKIKDSIPFFQKKYGEFFDIFNYKIIQIGNAKNPAYSGLLKGFITDYNMNKVYNSVNTDFKNFDTITNQLTDLFKHVKYYFPKLPMPTVITYVSGFNQSVVMTRYAIGISLDNYLGAKCPYYVMLGLPEYKRQNMYSDKIPTDVLYNWGISEFGINESKNDLISNMIYQGKMLYFLDAMFPEEPDYLKFGDKPEKLEWCKKNESVMWTYLIEHRLLFTTDWMNIVRFVGPAPFTSAFTTDSPGRAGAWLGWQIVKKYMKKNSEISLQALMSENDYQKILNDSGYSPE